MSNQIELTIDVSDELLAKLAHIMTKPDTSAIPMQALLGMALQPPPQKPEVKEREPIGFKA